MADHERGRDVVETRSIATDTDTSTSEQDGFQTPMSMPGSNASGAATPRAATPQPTADEHEHGREVEAGSYFKTAEAQDTPKAERVRPAEQELLPPSAAAAATAASLPAPPAPVPEPISDPTSKSVPEPAAEPVTATVAPATTAKEPEPTPESQTSETGSDEHREKDVDVERADKANGEKLGDHSVTAVESSPKDPNIVDWDGPDDPEKGVNWKSSKKWGIVATLSLLTFISPLASSMFAPSAPDVLAEFEVSGIYLESFVVSVYILGYAAGPIIIAPLSELYGRSVMYHSTNVFFIAFTIACALARNMGELVAFRFLAGIGGSAVLTMGAGTLSDMFIQEQRGRATAIWACGPLIGPVAGPVAGGFLSQAKGWRWVFWVIAMAAGAAALLMALVLSETYGPIILDRKTKRLRKETGNADLRSVMDTGLKPKEAFKRSIFRPLRMLIFSPIVALLTIYNAVIYGYLYLVFTTITEVFERGYGFSQGVVGLTFLGIGIGMFSGLIIFGGLSDWLLKRRAKKGEMKPEYRLPPMVVVSVFIPIGMFIYGWTAEKLVFWFWPIFGTAWLGFGLLGVFMCIQTYLIDAFTLYAASAIAANTIFRSLVGALLPLAGPSLYEKLGLGWGNSLLAFIATIMIPIPFLFYKYGERIRKNPRFQPNW